MGTMPGTNVTATRDEKSFMTSIRDRIKGSIPALITPFKDGKVDEAAFRKLVDLADRRGHPGPGSLRHHRRIADPQP